MSKSKRCSPRSWSISPPQSRWLRSQTRRWASTTTNEHPVLRCPTLLNPNDSILEERGIPGLYSPNGFKVAWTDTQRHLVDELRKRLTEAPPVTASWDNLVKALIYKHARIPAQAALFNHASMLFNNHFYMSGLNYGLPEDSLTMPNKLREHVERYFHSVSNLKAEFLAHAKAMFGGGFVWLVYTRPIGYGFDDQAGMSILHTYNAGTPLPEAHFRRQSADAANMPLDTDVMDMAKKLKDAMAEVTPLLCVSVWEHSYLPDYSITGKEKFLEAWWESINWQAVDALAEAANEDGRSNTRSLRSPHRDQGGSTWRNRYSNTNSV